MGEDELCATPCNHVGCWFRFDEMLHTSMVHGESETAPHAHPTCHDRGGSRGLFLYWV